MTQLLVSVRDVKEAEVAVAAGVDLIDVKEPINGPLGMAHSQTLEEIARAVNGHVPLSMACGELCDWKNDASLKIAETKSVITPRSCGIDSRFQFAKIGMQNCADSKSWQNDWRVWRDGLPTETKPVLVIYSDHKAANSPSIDQLLDFARLENVQYILIDTYDKNGPGMSEILTQRELSEIIRSVQRAGQRIVLAGKLTLEQAEALLDLHADYFAVRGSVCENMRNRASEISLEKIRDWKTMLSTQKIHCVNLG